MVTWQKQALDKAHALKLASNLLTKRPSELCAVAGSNPALLREWIEELVRWREQARRETALFDSVIDELHAAQHSAIRETAA